MRNTKNQAFTLVELIVVITILAILGTIAFISLQGYSQDAKNSKVTSDISSISQKINIRTTDVANATTLTKLMVSSWAVKVDSTATANSWAIVFDTTAYDAWTVNFIELQEDWTKFIDPEGNQYLYGFAAKDRYTTFQVVGQIKDSAGNYTAKVDGNYYQVNTSDALGLVADTTWTYNATGVASDNDLWTVGLY